MNNLANKITSASERFWSKVKKGPDCWEWTGAKYYNGYGQFYKRPNKITAHRYSYELKYGEAPKELKVCHKCDNRSCVNPEHLFLGTQKDNIQDMIKKGRRVHSPRIGEANGMAKITLEQVKQIRKTYKKEKISAKNLGLKYGISESQVLRIINNQSWIK